MECCRKAVPALSPQHGCTHIDPASDHRADIRPKRAIAARGAGGKGRKAAIENGALKIWLRTAPEDGKANKAVLGILAKLLGISVSQLEITHGQTARDKRVRVLG